MTAPARPNLKLVAKPKDGYSATVGVGWLGDSGYITVKLNLGVTLSWNDELKLTLAPMAEKEWLTIKTGESRYHPQQRSPPVNTTDEYMQRRQPAADDDGDIPF